MKIEPTAITFPLLVYGWRKPGYVELLRLIRFYRGVTDRYWCQRVDVIDDGYRHNGYRIDACIWSANEYKIDLASIKCLSGQPDEKLNSAGEIVPRPQPRKRRSS